MFLLEGSSGAFLKVFVGTGAVVAGGFVFWRWWTTHSLSKMEFREVGKVTRLFVYPVKSFRGIELGEAVCQRNGVQSVAVRDREYMVVGEDGNFVTARQEPTMVLIRPRIDGESIWLEAPGMKEIRVPKPKPGTVEKDSGIGQPIACRIFGEHIVGLSCGKELADWLTEYFGKEGLKLVHFPQEKSPREAKDVHVWDGFLKTDNSIFADTTAYMLLSEESLQDLNSNLGKNNLSKVNIRNFRPNITVQAWGGLPYQEETWKHLKIGGAVFRNVRPCTRCVFTTVDPETGVKDGIEPLRTLKSYKQITEPSVRKVVGESPVFGVHLHADHYGKIKVGDVVYAAF